MNPSEAATPVPIRSVLNDEAVGKTVLIRGWIHRIRWSKKVTFIVLRDHSGIVQCTVKENSPSFQTSRDLTLESSLNLSGKVRADNRAPGGYEVAVERMEVIGRAEPFPITADHSTPVVLDNSHLWVRSREMTAVMKVTDAVYRAATQFFERSGFYKVDPPILITAACEGGASLFSLNYFGKKAYLTQSSQLYLEAFIQSLEKVYCLAPSFRAEKSRTRRHLTEFWHLEAEEAFCDLWKSLATQESLIANIAHFVASETRRELRQLGRDPRTLEGIQTPFERISYDEAVSIISRSGVEIEWGEDFGVEHERVLTREFDSPFFVHSWPKQAKAFYHMPDPHNEEIVLCADMLAPEGHGEIIGGGQRIHDLGLLLRRIREASLPPEDYEWYLDLRRYGTCPHAGFGLGVARLVKWLCNLDHIRKAVPFPRTINRIYP